MQRNTASIKRSLSAMYILETLASRRPFETPWATITSPTIIARSQTNPLERSARGLTAAVGVNSVSPATRFRVVPDPARCWHGRIPAYIGFAVHERPNFTSVDRGARMPNLLSRLNLFRKKLFKPRPRLDAAALRKSGEGWTRANSAGALLKVVKPITDQEADDAMEEALREAEEEVRWRIETEEEEADATAQAAADRAGPEQAVEILAAAAEAKARRATEAPARREAARAEAIRRANKDRATSEQQSENAAEAARLVQAMSAGLEPDLPTLLQRASALRKPKEIAESLQEIFKTIELVQSQNRRPEGTGWASS